METQIRSRRIINWFGLVLASASFVFAGSQAGAQQANYFQKFGSQVPVVVDLGTRSKKMNILRIDPKLGKIYCSIPGVGEVNYELSRLEQQQVKRFNYEWPKDTLAALRLAADEQYEQIPEKFIAEKMRATMYPLLHYLEVPTRYFIA